MYLISIFHITIVLCSLISLMERKKLFCTTDDFIQLLEHPSCSAYSLWSQSQPALINYQYIIHHNCFYLTISIHSKSFVIFCKFDGMVHSYNGSSSFLEITVPFTCSCILLLRNKSFNMYRFDELFLTS